MCFEIFFAKCKKNTQQRTSLPSVKNTWQRRFCQVPKKQHSANHLALGKEPVSGSECKISNIIFVVVNTMPIK